MENSAKRRTSTDSFCSFKSSVLPPCKKQREGPDDIPPDLCSSGSPLIHSQPFIATQCSLPLIDDSLQSQCVNSNIDAGINRQGEEGAFLRTQEIKKSVLKVLEAGLCQLQSDFRESRIAREEKDREAVGRLRGSALELAKRYRDALCGPVRELCYRVNQLNAAFTSGVQSLKIHVDGIHQQRIAARNQCQEFEVLAQKCRTRADAVNATLEEQKQKAAELRSQVESHGIRLERERRQLRTLCILVSNRSEALKRQCKGLVSRVQSWDSERGYRLQSLENSLRNAKTLLMMLLDASKHLQNQLQTSKISKDKLTDELQVAASAISTLRGRIVVMEQDEAVREQTQLQKSHEFHQLEGRISVLLQKLDRMKAEHREELKEVQAKCSGAEKEVEELKQVVQTQRAELTLQSNSLGRHIQRNDDLRATLSDLTAQIKSNMELLESNRSEQEMALVGTHRELEKATEWMKSKLAFLKESLDKAKCASETRHLMLETELYQTREDNARKETSLENCKGEMRYYHLEIQALENDLREQDSILEEALEDRNTVWTGIMAQKESFWREMAARNENSLRVLRDQFRSEVWELGESLNEKEMVIMEALEDKDTVWTVIMAQKEQYWRERSRALKRELSDIRRRQADADRKALEEARKLESEIAKERLRSQSQIDALQTKLCQRQEEITEKDRRDTETWERERARLKSTIEGLTAQLAARDDALEAAQQRSSSTERCHENHAKETQRLDREVALLRRSLEAINRENARLKAQAQPQAHRNAAVGAKPRLGTPPGLLSGDKDEPVATRGRSERTSLSTATPTADFSDMSIKDTSIPVSSEKSSAVGRVVIAFSGFSDGKKNWTLTQRSLLETMIRELGGSVTNESNYHEISATHVVCPRNSRTMRSLAASLQHRWLIHDWAWITRSHETGRFLAEEPFGTRNTVDPFRGKRFAVTRGFSEEHGRAKLDILRTLIERIGNGGFVSRQREAHFVLVGTKEPRTVANTLSWGELIKMIP